MGCCFSYPLISFLSDPSVVRRILTHLGLPTEVPAVSPAVVGLDRAMAIDLGSGDSPTLFVDRGERGESSGEEANGRSPPG